METTLNGTVRPRRFRFFFDDIAYFFRGADRHGGFGRDHAVLVDSLVDSLADGLRHGMHVLQVGRAIFARRGSDRDKYHFAVVDAVVDVGGELQPPNQGVFVHKQVEAGLVYRQAAVNQALDPGFVVVHANHAVAHFRKARAGHQADIPCADDGDIHNDSGSVADPRRPG